MGDFDEDCNCPICAELASSGEPVTYMDARGQLVSTVLKPRPMMTVRMIPRERAEAVLGAQARTMDVPVGCIAFDFAAYVRYKFLPRRMDVVFTTRVNGEDTPPEQVLRPGDEVEVFYQELELGAAAMQLLSELMSA